MEEQRPSPEHTARSATRGWVRVGTSGWSYDHWRGHFYPDGLPQTARLSFYARQFSTVEVNNSFYRLPAAETLRRWAQAVPPDFLFAVKASRTITHFRRLLHAEQSLDRLLDRVRLLGGHLGPLLFQLPPAFAPDLPRLEAFLDLLPADLDHAFEFRDRRWLTDPLFTLLTDRRIALVLDDAGGAGPPRLATADLVYVRFHGPGKHYQGDYPRRDLESWADDISRWVTEGHRVLCYFNNDPGGHAVKNGLELTLMLEGAGPLDASEVTLRHC